MSQSGEYLAGLSKYLKQGMAIQISQIAGDPEKMDYLTHGKCKGDCKSRHSFKWG